MCICPNTPPPKFQYHYIVKMTLLLIAPSPFPVPFNKVLGNRNIHPLLQKEAYYMGDGG